MATVWNVPDCGRRWRKVVEKVRMLCKGVERAQQFHAVDLAMILALKITFSVMESYGIWRIVVKVVERF